MADFYDDYLDKIRSFSYDKLVLAIYSDPLLIHEDKLKEKMKEFSSRLKGWVESADEKSEEDRERSKARKALLIFHLCPWLIRSEEFSWLFQDICALIRKSHYNSEAFKVYWEALQSVKGKFRTTKIGEPELPFKVFGALAEQIKVIADKVRKQKSEFVVEVLKALYKHYDDLYYHSDLSRASSFVFEIVEEESRRLSELIERHCKNRQISPNKVIENNHHTIVNEIYRDENSNKKFWNYMFKRKQILKEEKEILPEAKRKVLKIYKEGKGKQKRKMSESTMQRHLKHINDLWRKSKV